jgi:hypothetical protein
MKVLVFLLVFYLVIERNQPIAAIFCAIYDPGVGDLSAMTVAAPLPATSRISVRRPAKINAAIWPCRACSATAAVTTRRPPPWCQSPPRRPAAAPVRHPSDEPSSDGWEFNSWGGDDENPPVTRWVFYICVFSASRLLRRMKNHCAAGLFRILNIDLV